MGANDTIGWALIRLWQLLTGSEGKAIWIQLIAGHSCLLYQSAC